MSPHFKGIFYPFLILLLLVAVSECTGTAKADEVLENSQKLWHCDKGYSMITEYKKAALCGGGECVWFTWHSTIVNESMILFAYGHDGVQALVIRQEWPKHQNSAQVIVKDQALGVATFACEYEPPLSDSAE